MFFNHHPQHFAANSPQNNHQHHSHTSRRCRRSRRPSRRRRARRSLSLPRPRLPLHHRPRLLVATSARCAPSRMGSTRRGARLSCHSEASNPEATAITVSEHCYRVEKHTHRQVCQTVRNRSGKTAYHRPRGTAPNGVVSWCTFLDYSWAFALIIRI